MPNYQALYRKWRPMIFNDVSGQEHITATLRNEVLNNKITHAYLFCGTRGTGKTTTARIFARAVNCENPQNGNPCNKCSSCEGLINGSIMDVYEIDAASNSGVDNIREIRGETAYASSVCKYKVYIIDEAHALSKGAFNALLKTLEEPPPHIIFILATTEAHKVPITILSRCQRHDFRHIGINDIAKRISEITNAEGISITPDAIEMIAEIADGSLRDGISLLDRCASVNISNITSADVSNIAGVADMSSLFYISDSVAVSDIRATLLKVSALVESGKDPLGMFEDLITHYRNILIAKAGSEALARSAETAKKYEAASSKYEPDKIIQIISILSEYIPIAKNMRRTQTALEMALAQCMTQKAVANTTELTIMTPQAIAAQPTVSEYVQSSENINENNNTPVKNEAAGINKPGKWAEWNNVISLVKKENKQLYGFLHSGKARGVITDNGHVIIYIKGTFAIERVKRPESIELLTRLCNEVSEISSVRIESEDNADIPLDTEPKEDVVDGMSELLKLKDQLGEVMKIED